MFTNSPVFLIVLSSSASESHSLDIVQPQPVNESLYFLNERLHLVNETIYNAIASVEADNVSLEVISEQL
jgi:hypothetical protein